MTLHLFSSIRHAMCRSGRGLCLAPRVFAVFRQLFLLGVLALSAVPAFADGVPSEPQDGLTAIKNALVPPQPSAEQPAPPPPPRIDPAYFDFTVETASSEKQSLPLEAWATRKGLIAATNASMYLPDGVTSTGYLRTGETVNNGRVVSKFGAFFVAGPDSPDLPGADLLDRSTDDWENLLPHYSMVVQNYRMISSDRRLLWKPGGPKHSISAVGRDGTGAILFILCREPITGVDFGALLLALPIDVRVVMYTEGGSLAGLFLRTPVRSQIWLGRSLPEFWASGSQGAPLPNVIGVRRKS